jgi:hypothetical protein
MGESVPYFEHFSLGFDWDLLLRVYYFGCGFIFGFDDRSGIGGLFGGARI